jgi:hypothetical protein
MLHTTLCSKQVELGHHTLQLLLAQTHEVIAGKLDELRKNKTVRRDGVLHVFWATTEYLVSQTKSSTTPNSKHTFFSRICFSTIIMNIDLTSYKNLQRSWR